MQTKQTYIWMSTGAPCVEYAPAVSGCCTLWWDSGTNVGKSGTPLIDVKFVPRSHHTSLQDGGKQSQIRITQISRPGWLICAV